VNPRVRWTLVALMRYPRFTLPWHRRLALDARDLARRVLVRSRRYTVIEGTEGFAIYDSADKRIVASWFSEPRRPAQIALTLNAVEDEVVAAARRSGVPS